MQALSKEQFLTLLSTAKARSEMHWLMMLVAYWHGLRASEVVGLTGGMVVDGFLTVKRGKGSLRTVQPLVDHPNPLLDEKRALLDLVSHRPQNQRIFKVNRQRFWAIMRRTGDLAGLPAHLCHPHVLKHSIAAHTIHSAGIENVRQWLGHKSMASTGEYLKVTDADAAKAIRAAS